MSDSGGGGGGCQKAQRGIDNRISKLRRESLRFAITTTDCRHFPKNGREDETRETFDAKHSTKAILLRMGFDTTQNYRNNVDFL